MARTSSPKSCSACLTTLAICVVLLATVGPAFAQPTESDAPDGVEAAAKDTFAKAVALYKEGKSAEALPLFLEVAEETGSPNARLYVGRCYADLRKYVEAYGAFAQTVRVINEKNDARYEETREAAIAQLSLLTARVAKLVVSVVETPSGLTVTVDGSLIPEKQIGSSLVLEPGAHRVEAQAPGAARVTREVEIEGGEVKTVTLSFGKHASAATAPESAASTSPTSVREGNPLRTSAWVAGGVGVAGLAVFAVAGLTAKGTYRDLESECGDTGCSDASIHRGKTQQTLANLGLVVGAMGVAAGGTLWLLGSRKDRESGASLAIAPGYGMISYRSRFR